MYQLRYCEMSPWNSHKHEIFAHANQSDTKLDTNPVFSYFEEIRIQKKLKYILFFINTSNLSILYKI